MVNRKKPQQLAKSVQEGAERSSQTKKKKIVKNAQDIEKSAAKAGTGTGLKEEEPAASESKAPIKRTLDNRSEGIVLQSSGRISKRPRKEYDPYSPPGRTAPKKSVKTPEARKGRKHRELWTAEDKKNFFEAVKEHGRDWKGLHEYFRKHRKRGELERSQEHLRQLYYRMWHKIVKYITCPPSVDKQVVEIFGLICYGEMRKRIGSCMDESIGAKLNEMVHKGTTFMKWKLKNTRKVKSFRLKTPQCTILKKLNSLEGLKYPKVQANPRITLPQEVCVELRPHSNAAWTHVQSLSQNPRLRTRIDPSKRLSSIVDFLNRKWQPHRARVKEGMNGQCDVPRRDLKLFPPPKCQMSAWDVMKFNRFKEAPRHQQVNLGLETYLLHLKNLGECSPSGRKGNKRTAARKPSTSQDISESGKGSADGLELYGDQKVKCEAYSTNTKDSTLRSIPEQTDGPTDSVDTVKAFSKFGLDSSSAGVKEAPERIVTTSVTSVSSPSAAVTNEIQGLPHPSEGRPLPTLMSPSTCDNKVMINPLVSLASPSTYDSTKDSHGTFSLNSEPLDTRSDLGSSPETVNSLSAATKSSVKIEAESVLSGVGVLGEDLEPEPANEEITRKIDLFRDGVNRAKADQFTLADLYLMMGHPDKIVLEYEWTDIVDTPDILDLSHVTNMLRRLIHLVSTECTDFNKLPPQLKRSEEKDEATSTTSVHQCTCGATTQQLGTPPNAKTSASSRSVRGRVRREPVTPKAGGGGQQRGGSGRDVVRGGVTEGGGCDAPPDTGQQHAEQESSALLPPGMKKCLYPVAGPAGNQSQGELVLDPAGQDVFKVPNTVPPRSVVNGSQTSPITINNIAQKLSPNALMEHINKANSHTNMLVPGRRRRNVRKPLIVQRKIMPKPLALATGGAGSSTYILNHQQQTSVIRGTPHQPRGAVGGSGGNVKVMHPADVKGLTIKSIIPQASEATVTEVHEGQEIQVVLPTSSQSPLTTTGQVSGQPFSSVGNTSTAESHVTTCVTSSNGQVPVMFDSFASLSSTLTSTQMTSAALSLISQAAMATGISMETGDSNTGDPAISINNLDSPSQKASSLEKVPVIAIGDSVIGISDNRGPSLGNASVLSGSGHISTSDLSTNFPTLLDISIPEPAGAGDTTDRMIDIALANSSSSFSVSALLDTPSCEKPSDHHNKDPTLNCTRAVSPGKPFKTTTTSLEEYEFNLSSFLADSPLKKPPLSVSATPPSSQSTLSRTSAATTVLSTSLLGGDCSRDSVRFDVDIALQSMLNENSLDYVSKFADLANEIAASTVHDDRLLHGVNKPH